MIEQDINNFTKEGKNFTIFIVNPDKKLWYSVATITTKSFDAKIIRVYIAIF